MSSIVFWIAYNASLTSGLTQEIVKLPFTNLEELSQTDYILMTSTRGNSNSNRFLHPTNALDQAIRQRNIDLNGSFVGYKKGLQHLLKKDNRALLRYENLILREMKLLTKEQQCDIKHIWRSDVSRQLSVAFKKDFEFVDNLTQALIQMKEHGVLQQIIKHNTWVPSQCPALEGGEPLGFKKMISIFIFITVSYLASVFILLCECCFERYSSVRELSLSQS